MVTAEVVERRRVRGVAGALLLVYLLVVAWVLLTPNGDVPSSGVAWLTRLAVRLHLPAAIVMRTEVLANVAIVVPVPVLAAYAWRPWPVLTWTGAAFCLSLAVELVQRFLLGERVASATDVVANTAGGLAGGAVSAVVLRVRRSRRDVRAP